MQLLQGWTATVNAFIEDTCVIFAVTYLLSRGRTIEQISSRKPWAKAAVMATVMGLLGASEVVFPTMRAPYVSHVLAICLTALMAQWSIVMGAIGVVTAFALFLDPLPRAVETMFLLLLVAAASKILNRLLHETRVPLVVGGIGLIAQATGVVACDWVVPLLGLPHPIKLALVSIPANGFGMFLIMLVICDSDARTVSERRRLDLERVRTLQVAGDLAALRARIRPHFLFNTLSALASLCATDPAQAERSILKLGRMMRRTLAAETTSLTNLEAELEYVKAYIDIQTLRFGGSVEVRFIVEPAFLATVLPAFGLQTLVENAFQHGFGTSRTGGVIKVVARRFGKFILLAVQDNGAGMDGTARAKAIDSSDLPRHGLGIIDKQLRLLFGDRARLRVLSRPGEGTLVAFRVPRSAKTEVHQPV